MFSKPLIATHSGHFHPDDVCAVATLHILLKGKYKLIRTRDQKIIDKADYVVDVGCIDDASKKRFDHHQKGGAGKRESGAPYAAFGLVWKEYGEVLCGSKEIANEIDKKIIAYADASDNGVDLLKQNEVVNKDTEAEISIERPYSFADFLFSFNPPWNGVSDFDKDFKKAVPFAVTMLEREITREKTSAEGKKISEKTYKESADKRIIELSGNYPWRGVFTKYPEPLFVIKQNEDGTWNVKVVPVAKTGFESRILFPEAWGGLNDNELAKVSGVSDARFCHTGRFIAVAGSREGAWALAQKLSNKKCFRWLEVAIFELFL